MLFWIINDSFRRTEIGNTSISSNECVNETILCMETSLPSTVISSLCEETIVDSEHSDTNVTCDGNIQSSIDEDILP